VLRLALAYYVSLCLLLILSMATVWNLVLELLEAAPNADSGACWALFIVAAIISLLSGLAVIASLEQKR